MCEFSKFVAFNKATNGQTDVKHKKEDIFQTYLCERGSFATVIFNSDIQLSFFVSFSRFISFCPFVALLKATHADNLRIWFCLADIKRRSFLTSGVF